MISVVLLSGFAITCNLWAYLQGWGEPLCGCCDLKVNVDTEVLFGLRVIVFWSVLIFRICVALCTKVIFVSLKTFYTSAQWNFNVLMAACFVEVQHNKYTQTVLCKGLWPCLIYSYVLRIQRCLEVFKVLRNNSAVLWTLAFNFFQSFSVQSLYLTTFRGMCFLFVEPQMTT